uniref:ACB domain-containing protein n=1 Tax=Micromonas pusilla TaxID=38833 RepID=A0A7S0ILC1_MICPS
MDAFEAMRLYVKLLDEEVPGWWRHPRGEDSDARDEDGFRTPAKVGGAATTADDDGDGAPTTPGVELETRPSRPHARNDDGVPRRPTDRRQRGSGGVVLADLPAGLRDLAPGRWARPNLDHDGGPDAKPPAARHQHGAVVAGSKMYIVGGAKQGGRLAGDAHELDLATLRWRSLEPKTDSSATEPTTTGGSSSIDQPHVKPRSTNVGVGWLERVLGLDDDPFGFRVSPNPKPPTPPPTIGGRLAPCSGHRLFAHRGCVYSVGGGFKVTPVNATSVGSSQPSRASSIALLRMRHDGAGASWEEVRTKGPAPRARRCAAAVVVGVDALLVHGGEDPAHPHRPLGDAHVLDLETMAWNVVCSDGSAPSRGETDKGETNRGTRASNGSKRPRPVARSEHAACAWSDDRVLVFGGVDASGRCLGDLWLLDVSTGTWTDLTPTAKGPKPGPRAGHAGAVVADRYWCVVGGGNGRSGGDLGCAVLDLDAMEWCGSGADDDESETSSRLRAPTEPQKPPRKPQPPTLPSPSTAGEGMSVCAVETAGGDGVLIAFGGYDGRCRGHAQAFRFPFKTFSSVEPDDGTNGVGKASTPNSAAFSPGVAAAVARGLGAMLSPMKIEAGVSSAEASARLRVDALTADNLRLRRENAQIREDARRVVNVQRTMETALEQQKRRCEALEKALLEERALLGEERERANASLAKVAELEAAAEASRARIKKLETGEEDGTEETTPAPNRRGNWFMNLLADTPENTP